MWRTFSNCFSHRALLILKGACRPISGGALSLKDPLPPASSSSQAWHHDDPLAFEDQTNHLPTRDCWKTCASLGLEACHSSLCTPSAPRHFCWKRPINVTESSSLQTRLRIRSNLAVKSLSSRWAGICCEVARLTLVFQPNSTALPQHDRNQLPAVEEASCSPRQMLPILLKRFSHAVSLK